MSTSTSGALKATPALHTTTASGVSASTAATTSRTRSASVTSSATAPAEWPSVRSRAAWVSASAPSRSARITWSPRAASVPAMPSPMPRAAPVTRDALTSADVAGPIEVDRRPAEVAARPGGEPGDDLGDLLRRNHLAHLQGFVHPVDAAAGDRPDLGHRGADQPRRDHVG